MKKTIFLPLFVWALNAIAQPATDLAKYQLQYKDADAVFLTNTRSVTVSYERGALVIRSDQYEDLMLLGTNVNKYSESSVGYSGLNDLLNLDAKTLVPDKNKYRSVAAKNIITEKSLDNEIFYDDYKSKKIYFTGLQPGAHRVVSYTQEIKMPQLLPQFFFQSYAPCEKSSYSITVPDNVSIEYQLFNVDKDQLHFTVEEKSKQKTYKWELDNVEALNFVDDNAPSIRYFMPHIVVRVKNYSNNGVNTNVLSSPDDLYKWYYGFIKDINKKKSKELQKVVDSLTHNVADDDQKIRNIFYWVQDHIRYVAFEDGLQGFIPREADSVCQKRYGDCKDMSSILTTMLKTAGFKAYPTWVGTRDLPYTYEELPSPLVDNHMISNS